MIEQSLVTLALVIVTVFVSYKGFNNSLFQDKYLFDVSRIMVYKEYIRLFSSGFLHNSWMHLLFNMLALYLFGSSLEPLLGGFPLLLIYFTGLLGGSLLALLIHKNYGDYTSVGASGAVNAIVFSSIALFPDMGIGFFFLPLSIPAWAFGLAYVLFSIFGIKAKWGNSGHAAHLGGAVIGMLLTLLLYPQVIRTNYLPILLILVPSIAFISLLIFKPHLLLTDSFASKKERRSIDQEYNYRKKQEEADIDSILEKIHQKGIKSLTREEKEALERFSKMKK
jgi:membrane associated rhomboid family serine protease